jgi:DNA-binding MarR family transcriptional regulator
VIVVANASVAGAPDARATFSGLVRTQTRLWNAVDARVRAEHDVPLTQVMALRTIATTEACRVGDLVDTLHITVGGASKVVDRLVAAGLVSRVANERDRRSPVLTASASGQLLLGAATPTIDAVLRDELAAHVSAEDLATLDRILGQLVAPPASRPQSRPGGSP